MATQQEKDLKAFFANTKPGEVVKVGNLTYTRGSGDSAQVTGPNGQTQTFSSTTDPQVLAQNSAAVRASYAQNYPAPSQQSQMGQPSQQQLGQSQFDRDFQAYQQGAQPGFETTADGFTFRVDQYGNTHVTTPSGGQYRFTPNSTPETIANHIPELAYTWNQKYGTDFNVAPLGPTYWGNYLPQMQIGGVAIKDMDPNDPTRQRIENVYRRQYGSSPLDANPQPFDPHTNPMFDPVRASMGVTGPAPGMGGQSASGPFAGAPGMQGGLLGSAPGMGGMPGQGMGGQAGPMPGFQPMPGMGGGFQAQSYGMPFMTTPLYGGYQPQFFNTGGIQAQQGQAYDPFTSPFGATNLLQNSWTRGA